MSTWFGGHPQEHNDSGRHKPANPPGIPVKLNYCKMKEPLHLHKHKKTKLLTSYFNLILLINIFDIYENDISIMIRHVVPQIGHVHPIVII